MTRLTHGFVFVRDLERMVRFYRDAFDMTPERSADPGYVMMRPVSGAAVALHELPADVAAAPTVERWREDSAYKLCFETEDVERLRAAIVAHGGQAKEPWSWEGRLYCDCADPEGNVLQILSERTPPSPH